MAELNQLQHEDFIARENLRLITGNVEFDPVEAMSYKKKSAPDFPLLKQPLDDLMALTLLKNPDYLVQQFEIELAQKNIKTYKLRYSPSVDAVFNYQSSDTSASQISYPASDTSSVELQLKIPLYQGGRRSIQRQQAIFLKQASEDRLESIKRTAQLETSRAYYSIESAIRQKSALEKSIQSHQSAVKAAERGQQLGERSTTDVLNAQQALFSTEHNLRLTHLEMLKNILGLYASVGQLNIEVTKSIFGE